MSTSTLDVLFAALDGSPDAVGVSHDGHVVRVNRSFATLFGYDDPDELRGRPLISFAPPQDREYIERAIAGHTGGDLTTSQHRTVALRKNGTVFDLDTSVASLTIDGVTCQLSISRDASAQRRKEEERRDREEFYRAMFEVNTAIKLLIDPADGSIVDANPAAAEFYGWPLETLRGMNVADINTLTPEQILAEMESARSRKRQAFRFRHRTASGALRDVDVYSGPLVLRGRNLLLSIIHDVTERNQLEEQLRSAQRLDAIGRLAAGIAHDFNNLLTVVMASAQIAERQLPPEHRVRAYLGDVRHAAQRGAELTRQLLAFARQQALTPVSIDLVGALARIASLLQRVLGDEIDVVAEVPDELPRVRFDPGQLELAIINIALNARDAMPHGGRLVLRAVAEPDDVDGPSVHMTIEDTGTGMDADTRARAFEPFFTTKPPGQGTGLGLATVYGIVSQSGGRIAIDSTPGAGTRVHVWLPIEHPAATSPAAVSALATPCAARSVLIVDDRGDVLTALSRSLADVGLEVHAVSGARAAVAKLAEIDGVVDVVLSDVAMPERSGVELAADVAARWPHLPVVLMSGDTRIGGTPPGVAAFLDKPFTLPALLTVLDRVVRAREPTGD